MDEYEIYEYVKKFCGSCKPASSHTIGNAVGKMGLDILRKAKLIEPCGLDLSGYTLYKFCCEEES